MKRVLIYGLEGAFDHTLSYLRRYLLLGIPLIVWTAWTIPWTEVVIAIAIIHVVSAGILLPGALLINVVAMRFARTRTWDRQPWRAWMAAFLGAGLSWGWYFSVGNLDSAVPAALKASLGDLAGLAHWVGAMVLTSTLGLVAAWSVPPSRGFAPKGRTFSPP